MTREERQQILMERAGERIKAFRKEPYMSAMLNLCDQLDAEGVGQAVDALYSEIKRSGHGAGFLLEVFCAGSLISLPQPRSIRCEQQEGMSKTPGDVWLDFEGRRYEFPCKDATNWTVELWMNEAVDAIAIDLKDVEPGRYYELEPELSATQQQWRAFREWFVGEFANLQVGNQYRFENEGRLVTGVKVFGERAKGVVLGASHSPGGVQAMDLDMLKSKLRSQMQRGKSTLSALPSAQQINCLTFDVVNYIVQKDDVFQALYGQLYVSVGQGGIIGGGIDASGLFHTDKVCDAYSAVLFQRIKELEPLKVESTVFPHPRRVSEVKEAFAKFTDFKVVESSKDVDL